ncbi:cupin domain-containing protein [Micromonospora sp. WMMD558]|uniref:cupin domain-containing protein n=1 Tax=unclassified Micromonospora TaxID=2617518 RepID=UPI0018AFCA2F|nr:cupin domain-containing protein [Micromonospora sp. WMMC415]
MPSTSRASGPVPFAHWYTFAEGGPVHRARLPFPSAAPAPFEVARWSVAPGTSNDLDVHRSREVWVIVTGTGTLTWADQTTAVGAGDVVAFESQVPHQVRNDGPEPLLAISVHWLEDDLSG